MEKKIVDKVKKISPVWAWLIVVVIAAAVAFYWFGIRPGQIRSDCYRQYEGSNIDNGGYLDCLGKNGLQN